MTKCAQNPTRVFAFLGIIFEKIWKWGGSWRSNLLAVGVRVAESQGNLHVSFVDLDGQVDNDGTTASRNVNSTLSFFHSSR
jgi:hypothetical protein